EDGIRDDLVTGVQTCALPISRAPRWSAATGAQIESSPVVADGVVYIGSRDSKLYAFKAMTGALLWSAPTGGEIQVSSPAVASGRSEERRVGKGGREGAGAGRR